MRYDLTDFEWSVIEPVLPMDRRGPKPRENRRVLNGIFCADRRPVARSARALPALHERIQPLQSLAQGRHLGPPDGLHCQGVRRQGADDRQLDRARSSACLGCEKKSGDRYVGRSRGGFTTKIHARVDAKGRPVSLLISPGEAHDVTYAEAL